MPTAKNVILIIAIIIVFTIFAVYGMNLFLEEPRYEDFCKDQSTYQRPVGVSVPIETKQICVQSAEFQIKQQECYNNESITINYVYDSNGCPIDFECSNCNKDFEHSRERWSKNYFISSMIIGIAAIILGALIFKLETIGAGLMGGGAVFIFVSAIRSWSDLSDLLRFILLGIILAVLIYTGIIINKLGRSKK